MGTTVVAGLFFDNKLSIAHVGDSRLYRLRDGRFEQVTLDHSLLQELVDRGLLLARGGAARRQQELRDPRPRRRTDRRGRDHEDPVQKDDLYLLCSDGLSDMVEDDDIHLTISTFGANLETLAKQLIQLGNDNGGRDNISVVLARVLEPFPAQRRVFDKMLGMVRLKGAQVHTWPG